MLLPKQKRALFFKRAAILIVLLCFALLLASAEAPEVKDTKAGLEYVAPEDVGWSSKKLEEAKAFAEKMNSAAVMVLYDGKVFISWGNVATKYRIHSIRKPLLSALYGIYWGRGKINLDATPGRIEHR
jgi:CubicO group peptidase (beta-lactamase class C family)